MGLAAYYRTFVKDFATVAKPLSAAAKKDRRFVWSDDCESAFGELKKRQT